MKGSRPAEAAIVAVGTELVADGRPDTNGVAIGRLLATHGVAAGLRALVPDDEEEIARVLTEACSRFPLVVATGGLGPTLDDVTREAVSRAFGLPLAEDTSVLKGIEERLRARGRELTPAARRQAMVPRGAEILTNAVGTAPGLLITLPSRTLLFLLPGVPHEMSRMMVTEVLPRLGSLRAVPLAWKGMKASGLTEVEVQRRLADLLESSASASLTLLASPMEITIIFRAAAAREVERLARLAAERLGANLFSQDAEGTLEGAVGSLLKERGLTLSTAESCTGGLLGALVTRVAGSSAWFMQGWVVYADEAKRSALGIAHETLAAHGAVSEQVAGEMARAAGRLSGSDRSLSITGIAGPTGGTPEKPVGTVFIGLDAPEGCRVTKHFFSGDRETIRLFAVRCALDRLRREVAGLPDP